MKAGSVQTKKRPDRFKEVYKSRRPVFKTFLTLPSLSKHKLSSFSLKIPIGEDEGAVV